MSLDFESDNSDNLNVCSYNYSPQQFFQDESENGEGFREPVISDDVSILSENEEDHQLVPDHQDLQDLLSDSEVLPNTQTVAVAVTKEKVKKRKSGSKEEDTDKKKKKKIYDVEEEILYTLLYFNNNDVDTRFSTKCSYDYRDFDLSMFEEEDVRGETISTYVDGIPTTYTEDHQKILTQKKELGNFNIL